MAFGNIKNTNSINLNIKTYSGNTNASNIFKKNFYTTTDLSNIEAYKSIDNIYDVDILKSYEELMKQKQQELDLLYKERGVINGLSMEDPVITEQKIRQLERELGLDHKEDLLETTAAHVGVFLLSFVEGIVDVGENIVDGAITVLGGVVSLGADLIGKDAAAESMQNKIKDIVSFDASGAMYDTCVSTLEIDEDIAYGWAHTAGNFTGEMAATIALQFVPGGTAVMMTAHGLNGMGKTAEKDFQKGSSFYSTFAHSLGNGAIEAAASGILYGPRKAGLLTKELVAGGKEGAKEFTSVAIDGEFDFKKAGANAVKAMVTTAVNELGVSKLTDKVTNKKNIDLKAKRIEKMKNSSNDDLLIDNMDFGSTTNNDMYQKGIEKLNSWEVLVNNKVINKFAKKVGTEVQETVIPILERE